MIAATLAFIAVTLLFTNGALHRIASNIEALCAVQRDIRDKKQYSQDQPRRIL